jgi:hypothetical protein
MTAPSRRGHTSKPRPGCCMCGVTHDVPSSADELRRMAKRVRARFKTYDPAHHEWTREVYEDAAKLLERRATRLARGKAGG